MAINQSKHTEKIHAFEKSDGAIDIHKFPREQYSFLNGIRDDRDFLIVAKKGVLDQMAEDATQDPESAKRVDNKETGLGYWTDSNGNLRHPGDGLDDGNALGNARQEFIDGWKK